MDHMKYKSSQEKKDLANDGENHRRKRRIKLINAYMERKATLGRIVNLRQIIDGMGIRL